jgi:hypothetical protein
MASGYTFFSTYVFVPTSGNSQAIHCNYIKSLQLPSANINVQEISMSFPDITDFKFLSNSITAGTGFTANKIYAIIQLVNNSGFTNILDVVPDVAKWKLVELTSQVTGYSTGSTFILTPAKLTSVVFKISLFNYNSFTTYNLNYLNYPISGSTNLCFGDEIYFLGNVATDIHADVYVTNLSIILPLNQFNSSTNSTWDGVSSVFVTEIGIYDGNNNLVAIGKLNDPVEKNSNISRTIQFAIDF